MVVAGHAADDLVDGGMGHGFVGTVAGMQVIAAVKAVGKGLGIGDAANGGIEVDATVEKGRRAQPLVELLAHLFAVFVVGAPTEDGQQGAAPHFQSECLGGFDVDVLHALLHFLDGGQVAPGTEGIDVGAYGMDDVVDAVLDDDVGSSCHVDFDGETRGTLQSVGLDR